MRDRFIIASLMIAFAGATLAPCQSLADDSVYVAQIGGGVRVPAGNAVGLVQSGDRNQATITQTAGQASAGQTGLVRQAGDDNVAGLVQSGGATGNLAVLFQNGSTNTTTVEQMAYTVGNSVSVFQTGNGNQIDLTQNGDRNGAAMMQSGDNNLMQATQTGDNNSLIWTQAGSNLSAPSVEMTGNQSLTINQIGLK